MIFKRLYFSISLFLLSILSFSNASPKDLWVKQFGTNTFDSAASVETDSSGSVHVAGDTKGTLPGQVNLGGVDAFLYKFAP
ncbi:MAG: hypothetical protein U0Z75_03940 [Deinococcaceae bacterium]